ncbi:rabankyrin-5 [Trichonephila inaurata madagascariensis]|uniref:Rabankyrin-5 n=1 Tax=Trichonephila inaurata madagascariensis TaxID=2747483 RepID=A0A8X6Y2S0_9ARAC|nr:rabankyrin-5 [Trichonephila inaurata madagascariensis]
MSDEKSKLERHLTLLREEYVKLQARLAESEKKYSIAAAQAGNVSGDSFIVRLLKTVADLFDKELYSDLTVELDGRTIRAHKFVLSARSNNWGVPDLACVDHLDLTDIPQSIGLTLLKWVYTDELELNKPDNFFLDLMRFAKRFELKSLVDRCENALLSSVNVHNCVKFYQAADEIDAATLKSHCSQLISNHWHDFTSEDFAHMSDSLLYKMFKAKTEFILHTAIKIQREDVVFLFLLEHDSQLVSKVNEFDDQGDIPLDLALSTGQESIAKTLVNHKANVNQTDTRGWTLLHRAVNREDEFSALFLIENKALVNVTTPSEKATPLHLVSSFNPKNSSSSVTEGMARVASKLLEYGADPNLQDINGNTCLHRSILGQNAPIFELLLRHEHLDLEIKNAEGQTVLWFALDAGIGGYDDNSFAAKLVKRGCCLDAVCPLNGDTLLHLACRASNEEAGIFLAVHGAKPNLTNNKGEAPLHISCTKGLATFTQVLLQKGANPNLQTTALHTMMNVNIDEDVVYQQTPLHLAILERHENTIQAIIDHKSFSQVNSETGIVVPNFNIKNSKGQTPLSLALELGLFKVAPKLLAGGANIDVTNDEGLTLLHQAIMNQNKEAALFLLENGADFSVKTPENESPLQLAVKRHLPSVVDALCHAGADVNAKDENGDCALWHALESGQEDIASILVKHGCDTNCWGEGPGGCYQTLLHRALDENNESVSCFLIRSGCDMDSPRRPSPEGRGEEEAFDGQSALHLAAAWGLEQVLQTLIEHGADVNLQDSEMKTPLHTAIANQNSVIISLLLSCPALDLSLRDRQGYTPFASAMIFKNNKAAEAILSREPRAAEQHDNKGRNFLHLAIQKKDIESILFLLSIHVNIHSRVQDSSQATPLHLAVETGSEIIVRNLLLAGAQVSDLTPQKQTALHIAALHDHSALCKVLLENGVDYDAVDNNQNNALHIACQKGNLASCRVLLTESQINAEAVNLRGQNPLHVLAQYGKENAAAIFDLFVECMPNYPVDRPDAEGNTPLLLAYINGNGNLCRALVRAGACLGSCNRQGINIFNNQVATKQLLYRLLDFLPKEPPWCEGETCMECSSKFGIKTRKHHCRHCGRVLCGKCSDKDVPILKFALNKPVRVCELCFDVLTVGAF